MTEPEPLDAIDTLELAELLEFTAHALPWRCADAIHADLQAHLRRWAQRLRPTNDTPHSRGRPLTPT